MNNYYQQQTTYQTTKGAAGRSSFGSTRDLVALLFRRRAIFLAVFITISAASAFSLRNQQIVYVAVSKVLVVRGAGAIRNPDARPVLHWWEEMKTEVEVARSREVAEMAVAALARQEAVKAREQGGIVDFAATTVEPVSADLLLGGLGVEPIDETDIIRLSYRALDYRAAIDGVNALTKAYMNRSRGVLRDPEAADMYSDELDSAQAEVDRIGADIATYKTKHSISDIASETIELTRQRMAVENRLIDARASLQSTRTEVESLERYRTTRPDVLLPSEEMKRDPQLGTYMRRLGELDSQLNTLLATYTRDNPQVRAVERDRESCIASINAQVDQFVATKRTTLERLSGELQAYESELARVDRRVAELPMHEAELRRMLNSFHGGQEHLDRVRLQHQEVRFKEEVDPKFSKLRLLSLASTASSLGGGARKQLFLVASLLLAFGLSFVAAFMVDTLDHTIKSPSDIEEALGVPVLASIREVRGRWVASGAAVARESGA